MNLPTAGDRVRIRRPTLRPRAPWPATIWHVTARLDTPHGPLITAVQELHHGELDELPFAYWPDDWQFATPAGEPLPGPTLWTTLPDPEPEQ